MGILTFKSSNECSIGLELELQLINPESRDLTSKINDLLISINNSPYVNHIKPEVTHSMVELNSSPHQFPLNLLLEMRVLQNFLLEKASRLDMKISGGGLHPFQKWQERTVHKSFQAISNKYGYLAKKFTVFGQHVHIGCKNGEDALYLSHILARFIPQFIALSASSPFYQSSDTGYDSARKHTIDNFPLSGFFPFLRTWEGFSRYFNKLQRLKVVHQMKNFYWDIRPRPEYGTVEVRVCDTPLTIEKAVAITAYIQAISAYILTERKFPVKKLTHTLYNYNQFQACRYGLNGEFINPYTEKKNKIHEDIKSTLDVLGPYIKKYNSKRFIRLIEADMRAKQNDASWLRKIFSESQSFRDMVDLKCEKWAATVMEV